VFRKRAAENKRQELRKLMIATGGLGAGAEDKEILASLIPSETVEQRKQELKKLRERTEEKYGGVMRFYDQPIPEERKKELRDMVTNKRRLVSQIELEKRYKDLDLMQDTFNQRFGEFMSDFPQAERSRVESYNKRKEIEVMCDYLLKKASENHLSEKRQRESEMP
jgi:hypothetical protein